ncbi:MAG: MFS transporter [Herpetosiphonaceae bacterium]|nr:MFS transporter [Herpetosiphonaceae bacterium]
MAMATAESLAAPVRPRLSTYRQAMLSLYWFATAVHWGAILQLLLPVQAEAIGGHDFKETTLGVILGIGALVSMVAAPIFGAMSDRWHTRWGRRTPWLVVGTAGNVICLILLAYLPATRAAVVPYALAFMGIELFNNLATAPYSALIPDMVPPAQRGSASGWQGFMNVLGSGVGVAFGFALASIGTRGAYWLIAAFMVAGMLGTVLTVHEPVTNTSGVPFRWPSFLRGLVTPFHSRDFTWVFLTRLLVLGGTLMIQVNMRFYMQDVLGAPFRFFGRKLTDDPSFAASLFFLPLLLGGLVGAYFGGTLSDRYGRKVMVYTSGLLQTVVVILLAVTHSFSLVVLLGIVFGLGYGAYQAVDWALATDILPSEVDYAKDMGVWHVTNTLPQFTAVPIAGFVLSTFQLIDRRSGNLHPQLGYTLMFALAITCFILGTVLVNKVRGVR